jgi:hypothetical protein
MNYEDMGNEFGLITSVPTYRARVEYIFQMRSLLSYVILCCRCRYVSAVAALMDTAYMICHMYRKRVSCKS